MSDKGKVIGNSILYSIGNIFLRLFSFFLIPLYTAYLTTQQYGEINLSQGFVSLVSCIIMSGLQYAVVRYYVDVSENKSLVCKLISTIINFLLIFCILTICILFSTYKYWSPIVFKGIGNLNIIFLSICIASTTGLYTIYQETLKGMQKAKKSISLTFVFFFLLLACNIITVVVLRLGAVGVLGSNLIVVLIMIGIMFSDLVATKQYRLEIDRELLKSLLKYSLPLLPHTLAFNISNLYSRILINTKLSISSLGLFSLASQFGAIGDQLSNSVQSAFQPWLFAKLNRVQKGNNSEISAIISTTDLLLWIYGGIFVIIGSWSREVINWMTAEAYHTAWHYVPIFIMSVAIKSPLYFYQNFMYYYKSLSKYIFICTLIGCGIAMTLIWYLIPLFGIYGVILADIIALSIRFIITKWILRNHKTYYSFSRVVGITCTSIIMVGIIVLPSYLKLFSSSMIDIIYKSLGTLTYFTIFFTIYHQQISQYFKTYILKIKTNRSDEKTI